MYNDQNSNYLLTFAKKWRHWGGGSAEDILVEFGLSPSEYFRQLQTLLDERNGAAAHLPLAVHEQLKLICQDRLRTARIQPRANTPER